MRFLKILFCTLLIIVAPLFAAGSEPEEDPAYPVSMTCAKVNKHVQETRWCKIFDEALISSNWVRPAVPTDSSRLHMIVLSEYCEKTLTLGVSTTVVFISPWFAGQYPWLMTNVKVLEAGEWKSVAEELVVDMEAGFELSSQGLADAIIKLNEPKENYKSVEGRDERYFEDDPIGGGWPNLRPELCRGTDIMFHMSGAR